MRDAAAALALTLTGSIDLAFALNILLAGRRSARWPQVRGIVRRAWTPTIGELLTGYAPPLLIYEYVVDGTVYEGSRVRYGGYWSPSQARRARYRYEVGAQMPVHYDPRDPTQAVLEPGVSPKTWFLLVVGVCLLLAGLYFGLF